jgi:lysozyme family protein
MRDNFDASLAATLKFEGNYSNDSGDRGGATMWGVTHIDYDAYRRSHQQDTRDVREMTEAERDDIYRNRYWSVIHGDDLPAGIDFVVWDAGVNSGNSRGANWLNAALGLPLTGKIDVTLVLAALKGRDNVTVINAAVDARVAFLKRIAHGLQAKFLRGWLSRCTQVRQIATAMSGHTPEAEARAALAPGDNGAEVRSLQIRLKALGYPVGVIDGEYGDATRRAVILFADAEHLSGPAGEWPSEYWAALASAKPAISPERAAATVESVAAVDTHMDKLRIFQRVLAFLGLGALGSGGIDSLPDTIAAFSQVKSTWSSLWSLAEGHMWLLGLIGAGAALVLVRILISEHLLAFQSGQIQGGEKK